MGRGRPTLYYIYVEIVIFAKRPFLILLIQILTKKIKSQTYVHIEEFRINEVKLIPGQTKQY